MAPEAGEGRVGVAVVGAAADTVECPPKTFQNGLPLPVRVPAVGTVVGIAVEFDGQAAAAALDNQVDAVAADAVLGLDPVAARDDPAEDVALEVGVKGSFGFGGGLVYPAWVLAVPGRRASASISGRLSDRSGSSVQAAMAPCSSRSVIWAVPLGPARASRVSALAASVRGRT